MTKNNFVDTSDVSVYKTREGAVQSDDAHNHFKGGVYRKVGEFIWQDGEFTPKHGDTIVVYEHIFPHQFGKYARHADDFNQIVDKPELGYKGPRFAKVKSDES